MLTLPLILLFLAQEAPATHPLDREKVMRALRKAVSTRPEYADAQIEIVDLSRFPAPTGEVEFEWKDLTPPASGQSTARWRGVIRHDVDHMFSIWAVVRLTVPCKRVFATQNIRPDEPITGSQLHEESYEGFPSDNCSTGIKNVIGKVTTHTISANTPLVPAMLAAPAAVLKGDQAVAEYHDDALRLSLPVIAERSGRIGEIIPVRNPTSHKELFARVTGEGKVTLEGGSLSSTSSSKDKQ